MNPNEFFYWLQGHFELSATPGPLSTTQADCIGRHIALVMEWLGDGKRGGGAHPQTIARLHEVRTFAKLLSDERPDDMRVEFTSQIRTIVNEQFVHVIDPQAGDAETQTQFNNIHSGSLSRPPVARC
jgi:hypothetical protein